jgi:hypothetical protein
VAHLSVCGRVNNIDFLFSKKNNKYHGEYWQHFSPGVFLLFLLGPVGCMAWAAGFGSCCQIRKQLKPSDLEKVAELKTNPCSSGS